jgi:hypothetical protein
MLEAIRRYEAQQSDLRRLVDDLAALESALEGVSESWRDAYIEAWGDLEISYAVMCDRGISVLNAPSRAAVNDPLVDLKRLVQGALDEVGTDE